MGQLVARSFLTVQSVQPVARSFLTVQSIQVCGTVIPDRAKRHS